MTKLAFISGLSASALAVIAGLSGPALAQQTGAPVEPITITTTTSGYDALRYEGALMIAEEWKKLGLDVTVEAMDWARIVEVGMNQHLLDVVMLGWGGRPERLDPYYWLYTMYHSSGAREKGLNIPHYLNPEYDALADEFAKVGDLERRRELAFQMQEIVAHDVPFIPFFRRTPHYGYNTQELGNVQAMAGMGVQNFWNWLEIEPLGENKVVRYGWPEDYTQMNPLATLNGNDHAALRLIYDQLFRLSLKGDITPWAAESLEIVDDLTYDVTLRDGMAWHDGEAVTVDDVKFTYDLIAESKAPYSAWRITALDRVEIVDEDTVRFVLKEPFAPFVTYALAEVFLLPEHIWAPKLEELGAEGILNWDNLPPVGSGPFTFEYWNRGVEAKLNANPNHFQPPKIESYINVPYGSVATLVEGLQAGEINISGWALEPIQIEAIERSDVLANITSAELGLRSIHLNNRKAPLDRVEMRRALAAATPKDAFVELVLEGYGEAAYNVVAIDNTFWHNPDTEKLGNDLEGARAMLEEAGFTWDAQGKLHYPAQ